MNSNNFSYGVMAKHTLRQKQQTNDDKTSVNQSYKITDFQNVLITNKKLSCLDFV